MLARLTDANARNAKRREKAYKLFDGGGLFLLVKPTGAKLWRYRYRKNGSEKLLALGAYPEVGLQHAREQHLAARRLLSEGVDPSAKRKSERLLRASATKQTFESVASDWIKKSRPHWSDYYAKQVATTFVADLFPHIGAMPIREVLTPHLHAIVTRVAERGAPTVAILIRQWCSALFCFAEQTGATDRNPALALRGAIKRPPVRHKMALSEQEISSLLTSIENSKSTIQVRIALRLLMLTFVRPSELRNATWDEFDLENGEWQIPGQRMKMREIHIVPLSRQAIALLAELKEHEPRREQLFPNMRDPRRTMSITTMNRCLERLGYAGRFSAHGFRATASTYLNEHGYRLDAIERQLAHRERNKIRGAYNRAEYLLERRKMMQDWANYLDTIAHQ